MRNILFGLLLSILFCACNNTVQTAEKRVQNAPATLSDSLREKLQTIIHASGEQVGLAVLDLETGDTLSINGDRHFALMSVAKFPQALMLLHLMDEGKLDRNAPLHLSAADLQVKTASTLLKDHPQPAFDLSIPEALRYSIGQSDNVTSNKIFNVQGGPEAVAAYVHSLGINDIGLATDYAHMRPDSLYKNWSTPRAMTLLLRKFYRKELLLDSSQAMLWNAMVNAVSGPGRLKGLLPAGTEVAHKTGTSGMNELTGTLPAVNDAGIIRLPNGRRYAIAVFVAESRKPVAAAEAVIAQISKAVWDSRIAGQQ